MIIRKKHPFTGEVNQLDLNITYTQLGRWKDGEHIQNAMPHLTPDEREFMISGLLPGEYDEMYGRRNERQDAQTFARIFKGGFISLIFGALFLYLWNNAHNLYLFIAIMLWIVAIMNVIRMEYNEIKEC